MSIVDRAALVGVPSGVSVGRSRRTLRLYYRLGNFNIYQHAFGGLIALTALGLQQPRNWTVCLLAVLSFQFIVSCTCTLDDLTGFRNGSDARNYLGANGDFVRDPANKPLLSGALTERDAVSWAAFSMIAALAIGGTGLVLSPYPWAGAWIMLLCAALSPQYSWGLKFSYHFAGGEATMVGSHALCMLWPYAAVRGRLDGVAVAEAFAYGASFLLVSIYSNENDQDGDRAVARKTLAAMFGTSGTVVGITLLLVGQLLAVPLTLWAWSSAPGANWLLVALAPGLSLNIFQAWQGIVRRRWMFARSLGFKAMGLTFVGMILYNVWWSWLRVWIRQ
jgi:1,4-dihydroxy-2-naphthoate polyprenyltransferase